MKPIRREITKLRALRAATVITVVCGFVVCSGVRISHVIGNITLRIPEIFQMFTRFSKFDSNDR